MIHSTATDRAASSTGSAISLDDKVGYTIAEVRVERSAKQHSLPIVPGVSFYCIEGRGWASVPGGKARYVIEPGVILSAPSVEVEMIVAADQDVKLLRIAYAGQDSPWTI